MKTFVILSWSVILGAALWYDWVAVVEVVAACAAIIWLFVLLMATISWAGQSERIQ